MRYSKADCGGTDAGIGKECLGVRSWLDSEVQSPDIDFRLYEALVVKVVVVCVA